MDYTKEWNIIFNRFVATPNFPVKFSWINDIPEGYEIVEKEEHKRERLTSELQQKKKMLAYHEKALASLSEEISAEEKELLSLTQ